MQVQTVHFTSEGTWSAPLPRLDSPSTLVFVFGHAALVEDPAPLAPLLAAYPTSKIVGCSTAGEIVGARLHDHGISVAVARFDATRLRVESAIVATPADCEPAGRGLADALRAPDLAAVFVLSDGINVNGSDLLRGLNGRLEPRVIVTGGLAGDGDRFQRTWVIEKGQLRRHRVVAVGLYGSKLRVGHGSRGGWEPFGAVQTITRSDGNVLYEVDGKPALRVYKKVMGELAAGLPAAALMFPLGVTRADGSPPLVRTILAVDEATQSMTFAGDVPQGSLAQFMRATVERLIEGASEAARLTRASVDAVGPSLSIAVSCVGRRLAFGGRAADELAAVARTLPKGAALAGFYAYGEISPAENGRSELHNQTMTLTQLSEAP